MIIPRKGDIWEVKRPNKPKITKEIGSITTNWYVRKDGTEVKRPYAEWSRRPKGRYSGIRIKWLLKYGTRISTKAEREAHFDGMIARAKERRASKI